MNVYWHHYQPSQTAKAVWLLSLDAPRGDTRFIGSLSREMKYGGWVYVYSDWTNYRDKIVSHADTQEDDAEFIQAKAAALQIAIGAKLAQDAPKSRIEAPINFDSFNGFIPDAAPLDGLSADMIPLQNDPLNDFFTDQ